MEITITAVLGKAVLGLMVLNTGDSDEPVTDKTLSVAPTINWGATGEERIIQNVMNILRTRMFEVPFMRDLGINPDFLDSTSNEIKSNLFSHVTEVVEANENRVKVKDVRIDSVDEYGDYVIAVDVEV